MPTEVWMRNPKLYIEECVELGVENYVWHRGFLQRNRMDPRKYMDLYIGQSFDWRMMLVGDQGCTEYVRDQTAHTACYPTWEYGDDYDILESMINNPAGDNPDKYWSKSDPEDLKPVEGQENRIVLLDMPSFMGANRGVYADLAAIQRAYPNAILHLHGSYSYGAMFGLGYASTDVDPRTPARRGKVMMPPGVKLTPEKAADYPKWVKMLGFRLRDLKEGRQRCMFNMLSAGWAAKHWTDEIKWTIDSKKFQFDPDNPMLEGATDTRIMLRNLKAKSGDKWLCNTCSIQLDCKFFREGAVCAVPDSEPTELAQFFKTRDSETIIEGLGTLLAAQTRRANRAMEKEDASFAEPEGGKLDPELTKIINNIFDRGVTLAKLVNPSLRGGPKVAINSNNNTAVLNAASPSALMAVVVEELASRGVAREDITPDMVMTIVRSPEDLRHRAIEAAASAVTGGDVFDGMVIDDDEDGDEDEDDY